MADYVTRLKVSLEDGITQQAAVARAALEGLVQANRSVSASSAEIQGCHRSDRRIAGKPDKPAYLVAELVSAACRDQPAVR